jgi:hypothetical protein
MSCARCSGLLTRDEATARGLTFEQWRDGKRHHDDTCPLKRRGRTQRFKSAKPIEAPPANRALAGEARLKAAIEHLHEARESLDAACRDICSVKGASRLFSDLSKLSNACRDTVHEINHSFFTGATYVLDFEPTDKDFSHPHSRGCGKDA